jgi:hypothetical protein
MGFKAFIATLYSPSVNTFISRKIAGWLYIILVSLVTIAGLTFFLQSLWLAFNGFGVERIFAALLTPVATLISVVILRLVFESSIALIVIAENTTKD